jgi:hypothetical protein
MQHRGRRILSANATMQPSLVVASTVPKDSAYIKILDCHGLVTSKTGNRLMHTMFSVLPPCLLVTIILWTIDQGVFAVEMHVVDQVASLDLLVATL